MPEQNPAEPARGDQPADQPNWLDRLLNIQPGEGLRVCIAFAYIFILLNCWYLLRPIRESMGAANSEVLAWLYSGTFIAMLFMVPLFGWIVSRFPRRVFIPFIYLFFLTNLLFFISLFQGNDTPVWAQRSFFIWSSVFNLFVVSIFWSFMVDVFRPEQGRRLFGVIIAGGSVGALVGSLISSRLTELVGSRSLMMLAAVLLLAATGAALIMGRFANVTSEGKADQRIGGGLLDGITEVLQSRYLLLICLLMLLHNFVATYLYNGMAVLVADGIADFDARSTFFARLNLYTQVATFLLQFFITSRLVTKLGLKKTAILVPLVIAAGLSLLGGLLTLGLFAAVQIAQRAFNYGMVWPIKEMLFTAVPRSAKYKSKNFIDTFVYRGSDVTAAWVFKGLYFGAGFGLQAIALMLLPLVAVWVAVAWKLGGLYESRTDSEADTGDSQPGVESVPAGASKRAK